MKSRGTKTSTTPAAPSGVTRRLAFLAALTAPLAAPVAKAAGYHEHELVKAARLLSDLEPPTGGFSAGLALTICVQGLHSVYRDHPFSVPDWLAQNEQWCKQTREWDAKHAGTYCEHDSYDRRTYGLLACDACGKYFCEGDEVHFPTAMKDGEETDTPTHCAKCCRACNKHQSVV